MTEMLERIIPEMSEEEVLGLILDEIMARAEPDVAEAIRFCAIPHWFNEEIIAWLRGEGLKPSRRSREILAALTELTFVGPYYERGWACHESVRDLLLHRWWERNGEEFKELSGRAASYFGQKAEAATDEERDEWEREQMYHLLVADEEQGHELFQSMFDEAIRFYRLSTCSLLLQLAGEFREHLSEEHQQWLRYDQGQLAYQSARWDEALESFEALLEEKLVDELRGEVLSEAALAYKDKGEWERAIEYCERSLAIKEKVGDEQRMAATFNNLGEVYRVKGEWEQAIECYERSLAIDERWGDEHGMATTFNNLGLVYKARGEWERAIEYFEKDLAICEKVGDEHGMAPTFNNLGLVYKDREEWERAVEYYELSLAIVQKIGDEHGMAFVYKNIATLYQDQGRLEEAIPFFEKSLEIFERIGDKPSADIVRGNLEQAKQELEAKTGQV
jgi:tetratricopeptide (TPR) repeat protein